MTKTIKICDKCKQEVDWLYIVPWVHIEGLELKINEGKKELCEHCMGGLCELISNYHNTYEPNENVSEEWYLEDGKPKDNNMNFCPRCGARMDGDTE